MVYEWNAAKAKANLINHSVSFKQAATNFLDPMALTLPDPAHSFEEARDLTVDATSGRTVVFVSPCQQGPRLRIISARKATANDRGPTK